MWQKVLDKQVHFQNFCHDLAPCAMGARIFWGMIVPLGIFILLVFGNEAWRRICPSVQANTPAEIARHAEVSVIISGFPTSTYI